MSLYECSFCGEQVTRVSDLKYHMKTHHKDKLKGKDYIECKFWLNLTGVSER